MLPRLCANLDFLFTELPLLDRFDAAAEAGFGGASSSRPTRRRRRRFAPG